MARCLPTPFQRRCCRSVTGKKKPFVIDYIPHCRLPPTNHGQSVYRPWFTVASVKLLMRSLHGSTPAKPLLAICCSPILLCGIGNIPVRTNRIAGCFARLILRDHRVRRPETKAGRRTGQYGISTITNFRTNFQIDLLVRQHPSRMQTFSSEPESNPPHSRRENPASENGTRARTGSVA